MLSFIACLRFWNWAEDYRQVGKSSYRQHAIFQQGCIGKCHPLRYMLRRLNSLYIPFHKQDHWLQNAETYLKKSHGAPGGATKVATKVKCGMITHQKSSYGQKEGLLSKMHIIERSTSRKSYECAAVPALSPVSPAPSLVGPGCCMFVLEQEELNFILVSPHLLSPRNAHWPE